MPISIHLPDRRNVRTADSRVPGTPAGQSVDQSADSWPTLENFKKIFQNNYSVPFSVSIYNLVSLQKVRTITKEKVKLFKLYLRELNRLLFCI